MEVFKNLGSICLVIIFLSSISSCTNDEPVVTEELTDEEVVEIVEASMSTSTAGCSELTTEYAKVVVAASPNETCDSLYQQEYDIDTSSARGQATYHVDWIYEFDCNNFNIPQAVTATINSNGSSSSQRITSNDSSVISMNMTGLQLASDSVTLNGTFDRMGSQTYTSVLTQNTKSIETQITITLTDVVIGKGSYEITSGTGTFTISGTVNGSAFSHTGSLTFLGNLEATLLLNGTTYDIDLN